MEEINNNMKNIKHKIAILSGKGGVGKTTISINLASQLAKNNTVGLLDTDITGPNVAKMLGVEDQTFKMEGKLTPVKKDNIKIATTSFLLQSRDTPVIWRGPMKTNLIHQFLRDINWGKLDYLIIDLPPGTADEALTVAKSIPELTGVIIITTPQDVSNLDARKAINFTKELGLPIFGIVENMSGFNCPHCQKEIDLFGTGGGEKTAAEMNVDFLGKIPLNPLISKSSDTGKPFTQTETQCNSTKAFQKITEKVIKKCKK